MKKWLMLATLAIGIAVPSVAAAAVAGGAMDADSCPLCALLGG